VIVWWVMSAAIRNPCPHVAASLRREISLYQTVLFRCRCKVTLLRQVLSRGLLEAVALQNSRGSRRLLRMFELGLTHPDLFIPDAYLDAEPD
jgi:hypothetical protein